MSDVYVKHLSIFDDLKIWFYSEFHPWGRIPRSRSLHAGYAGQNMRKLICWSLLFWIGSSSYVTSTHASYWRADIAWFICMTSVGWWHCVSLERVRTDKTAWLSAMQCTACAMKVRQTSLAWSAVCACACECPVSLFQLTINLRWVYLWSKVHVVLVRRA